MSMGFCETPGIPEVSGYPRTDELVRELVARVSKLEGELAALRKHTGGASAFRFHDLIVIAHPDIPPHIWNGKTLERLEPIQVTSGPSASAAPGSPPPSAPR